MLAYLQLLRPGNVILVGFAVFVGAFVAVGRDIVDYQNELKIAILCSMMLVGGGNALNDYNDRKTDRKNQFSEIPIRIPIEKSKKTDFFRKSRKLPGG